MAGQEGVRRIAGIAYLFTRKGVKNINLRVHPDGTVKVSANHSVPLEKVDAFVSSRREWILNAQARMRRTEEGIASGEQWSDAECLRAFEAAARRIYPLIAGELTGAAPLLRVRLMKSRWGVCHTRRRVITLNKALMGKPAEALEYVLLHEYVHLLHPDHQAGFHSVMTRLMPDYKERRALLK